MKIRPVFEVKMILMALGMMAAGGVMAAGPAPSPDPALPHTTQAVVQTGDLDVTVTNVRSNRGHVRVAVCVRADFLKPMCDYTASVPAEKGQVEVRVKGIPAGVYAVQSWHDENDNKDVDRNFLGIPTESMGFSNDARMHFGPPRFEDAAIQLTARGGHIVLPLHDF